MESRDGIDHINVYSKGETEFGRMLSNFYHFPFTAPEGIFQSIEGYWYYLGIEPNEETEWLKQMTGNTAKQYGRTMKSKYKIRKLDDFQSKILDAIWIKMIGNLHLFLPEYRYLPLEHYYMFNGTRRDAKNSCFWMIDEMEKMKDYIYEKMEESL